MPKDGIIPDILKRLELGARAATLNAEADRKKGLMAFAATWDQFAANMEEAAAEIRKLRGRRAEGR